MSKLKIEVTASDFVDLGQCYKTVYDRNLRVGLINFVSFYTWQASPA
jgi:hypothetical protein